MTGSTDRQETCVSWTETITDPDTGETRTFTAPTPGALDRLVEQHLEPEIAEPEPGVS